MEHNERDTDRLEFYARIFVIFVAVMMQTRVCLTMFDFVIGAYLRICFIWELRPRMYRHRRNLLENQRLREEQFGGFADVLEHEEPFVPDPDHYELRERELFRRPLRGGLFFSEFFKNFDFLKLYQC